MLLLETCNDISTSSVYIQRSRLARRLSYVIRGTEIGQWRLHGYLVWDSGICSSGLIMRARGLKKIVQALIIIDPMQIQNPSSTFARNVHNLKVVQTILVVVLYSGSLSSFRLQL
jgi:hypothetical protein